MQRLRLALPRPARGLAILLCFVLITPIFNSIVLAQPRAPVDDVIDSLAQAGIAVYEDFEGRNPIRPLQGAPSALRLTRWQVENLAREVDDGGGYLGEQYDALAGLPPKTPPFSYFIAAWIAGGHSPAARYAQRIMGKQDWRRAPTVVFPLLTLVLFVGDAARTAPRAAASTPHHSFDIGPYLGERVEAAGICSSVTGFVRSVIDAVFNALQVSASSFWAALWNGVLTLASGFVYVVLGSITKPLVDILTTAATVIATISLIKSSLQPWQSHVVADPRVNHFGIAPGSGLPGDLIVVLDAPQINWPRDVVDCARAAGVDLNSVTYVNSPVTWKQIIGIPQLATQQTRDNEIKADKTATLHYLTNVEPPPPSCANEVSGVITVNAAIKRNDIQQLWNMVQKQILLQVPEKLRKVIQPILEPKTAALEAALFAFKNPSAVGSSIVTHHVAPPNCSNRGGATPTPKPRQPPGNFRPCQILVTAAEVSALVGTYVRTAGGGAACAYAVPGQQTIQGTEMNGIVDVDIWPPSYAAGIDRMPGSPIVVGNGVRAVATTICSRENAGSCGTVFMVKNGMAVQISVTSMAGAFAIALNLARIAAGRM